jgi:hypothetical protein
LYVATKLGDLLDDLVIVGGLVPCLLIDQKELPEGVSEHIGTMDLDLGLAFALVDERRYSELSVRLRGAGFHPDKNDKGIDTRQRWCIDAPRVTMDFLIEPNDAGKRPGKLFDIEQDLAAIVVPGLRLAFKDRCRKEISGLTIRGEQASRQVWVCGPGAFVVLKALAFRLRGENKDAYDLFYVTRNYGEKVSDVGERLKPLLDDPIAVEAIEYLKADFLEEDGLGPRRVAEFLYDRPDADIQTEVTSFVRRLLESVSDPNGDTRK